MSEIEDLKNQISTLKEDFQNKLKEVKLSHVLDKAKDKIQPRLKEMSPAELTAYESKLKNIKIDLDEDEKPFIIDDNGKRKINPNKVGTFLSLDEAVENEVAILNLFKKDVKSIPSFRNIHPAAVKHAEVLKKQSGK
jgi:hypothetical protein